MSDFVTPKELAEAVGISVKTVYEQVARGVIPVVRLNRTIRIKRTVYEQILEHGFGNGDGSLQG